MSPLITTLAGGSAKSLGGLGASISAVVFEDSYESIASTRLTSAATSITFSGIPSNFKHLQFRWAGATTAGNYLRFNTNLGSTGAKSSRISYYGGAWYNNLESNQDPLGFETHFGGIDGSYPAIGIIDVMDYSSSSKVKIGTSRLYRGYYLSLYNTLNFHSFTCGANNNTGAVNSVIFTAEGDTLVAGTTASLYGIRG